MKGRPRTRTPAERDAPPTGARSGPRARAAQQRSFSDPYQRAERPPRERLSAPAGGAIRLDPDVARVFRDAESVNEALRLVIRLARFAGGRPQFADRGPPRDRKGPRTGERTGPPRGDVRRPGGPPRPRFDDSE